MLSAMSILWDNEIDIMNSGSTSLIKAIKYFIDNLEACAVGYLKTVIERRNYSTNSIATE